MSDSGRKETSNNQRRPAAWRNETRIKSRSFLIFCPFGRIIDSIIDTSADSELRTTCSWRIPVPRSSSPLDRPSAYEYKQPQVGSDPALRHNKHRCKSIDVSSSGDSARSLSAPWRSGSCAVALLSVPTGYLSMSTANWDGGTEQAAQEIDSRGNTSETPNRISKSNQ
jgi:hypothetical protein